MRARPTITSRDRRALRLGAIPEAIRCEVQAVQVERALSQVPMLYAVGLFNLGLVAILCWHQGLPPLSYGWMAIIVPAGLWRMLQWRSRARAPRAILDPARMLRTMTVVSILGVGGLSAWTAYALWTGLIANMLLIPVTLVFGATCIAHCLAPVKRAAVGSLIVGVMPPATVMLLRGDFATALLGGSMITIALLMITFLLDSYRSIVSGIVMEQEIKRLAHSDSLTGLANRRAVMERLEETHRSSGGYAIVMLDLDGFKQVNDTLGHPAGDALLQSVAERLVGAAYRDELVGRMGGDEFLILIPGISEPVNAEIRVRAFSEALCRPTLIGNDSVPVSGSFGFAFGPGRDRTADEVLAAADRALYDAKRAARQDGQPRLRSVA